MEEDIAIISERMNFEEALEKAAPKKKAVAKKYADKKLESRCFYCFEFLD